jgi:EAL domain-containing protein (putative c-di-GMP-specific phosphodiesterase class I)
VQVGEWVLEQACAQAAIWQRAGLPPFRLAVNVSAREFTSSLPGRVADTLKRYRIDASWLELEITESTLMHDIDYVIGIMDHISALGVALSLDDFGTGYSLVLSEALPDRHPEDRPLVHDRHPFRCE